MSGAPVVFPAQVRQGHALLAGARYFSGPQSVHLRQQALDGVDRGRRQLGGALQIEAVVAQMAQRHIDEGAGPHLHGRDRHQAGLGVKHRHAWPSRHLRQGALQGESEVAGVEQSDLGVGVVADVIEQMGGWLPILSSWIKSKKVKVNLIFHSLKILIFERFLI